MSESLSKVFIDVEVDAAVAGDADLAKKRAEAVKWYLVDQGVAQDQIETIAGPDADKPIEITLR